MYIDYSCTISISFVFTCTTYNSLLHYFISILLFLSQFVLVLFVLCPIQYISENTFTSDKKVPHAEKVLLRSSFSTGWLIPKALAESEIHSKTHKNTQTRKGVSNGILYFFTNNRQICQNCNGVINETDQKICNHMPTCQLIHYSC